MYAALRRVGSQAGNVAALGPIRLCPSSERIMVSAMDTFSGSVVVWRGSTNVCESAWVTPVPNTAGNGCMLNGSLAAWKIVTSHSPSQYRRPRCPGREQRRRCIDVRHHQALGGHLVDEVRTRVASASSSTTRFPLSASTFPPAWLYRV